ncbi:hypothetical protein Tco_0669511, partial [Tanacetum coccineum]
IVSVSHIVDLDLSKLSIVLPRLVRSYTLDLQEVRHNEEESDEEIQGANVEEEELDE